MCWHVEHLSSLLSLLMLMLIIKNLLLQVSHCFGVLSSYRATSTSWVRCGDRGGIFLWLRELHGGGKDRPTKVKAEVISERNEQTEQNLKATMNGGQNCSPQLIHLFIHQNNVHPDLNRFKFTKVWKKLKKKVSVEILRWLCDDSLWWNIQAKTAQLAVDEQVLLSGEFSVSRMTTTQLYLFLTSF